MTISKLVNTYVDGLNTFKKGGEYRVGGISYSIMFDPSSYDQVLLFLTEDNYNNLNIQFACTEFGIYIRDEELDEPQQYFYHTLMYTRDFGFSLNDLANVNYIFHEMKKS